MRSESAGLVAIDFGRLRLFCGAIKDLSRMDDVRDTRALFETQQACTDTESIYRPWQFPAQLFRSGVLLVFQGMQNAELEFGQLRLGACATSVTPHSVTQCNI